MNQIAMLPGPMRGARAGRCGPCGISDWHPEARTCQLAGCPLTAATEGDEGAGGPAALPAHAPSPERERA
ncbi:MAG: hypothetical protein JWN66_2146 [Sphingomonas bacterium]|uniref:hypothetical protein n=1 Tax=Sphingomonas bacterium TaxID=1895847 RepID=UPI00262542C4|nr:hypothetical protein [Sphingomonas bacterium]MDB5705030.1 hypothetical protein [Sphingomonas bacterium]